MISVKPEHVVKILNGEKTLEIRKSMPKCELPCKVYIYCNLSKRPMKDLCCYSLNGQKYKLMDKKEYDEDFAFSVNGFVVAEFILNKVEAFEVGSQIWLISDEVREELNYIREKSCLSQIELIGYLGRKYGYAWHIEDLKIYDEPKDLRDFHRITEYKNSFAFSRLKRPPQSWCYMEEHE